MSTSTTTDASATTRPFRYAGEAHELSPVLSERYALQWQHFVVCLGFVLLFMYVNHVPIGTQEVWRTASIGRWIGTQSHLSEPLASANPSVPLLDAMPHAQAGWLGRFGIAKLMQDGGAERLSSVTALVVLAMFVGWSLLFYAAGHSKRFLMIGSTLMAIAWFPWMNQPGPQWIAGLCFVAQMGLLWPVWWASGSQFVVQNPQEDDLPRDLTTDRRDWISRTITLAAVLCVWANVDGSIVIGIGVLLAATMGILLDASYSFEDRSWSNPFATRQVQRVVLTIELALLATLINPQGAQLWNEVLLWTDSPIWIEWGRATPLQLASIPGITFCLLCGLHVAAWRHSQRHISFVELFVLTTLALLTAVNLRWIGWFAPVLLLFAGFHWRAVFGQNEAKPARVEVPSGSSDAASTRRPLAFAFTLFCLLAIWVGFALSPISAGILGGTPRFDSRLFAADTPLALGEVFRKKETQNLVWAPSYWADWLIWKSPTTSRFYCDSHVWQLPPRAQHDYARLYQADGDWQRIADRYAIHTLVIDKQKQLRLASEIVKRKDQWILDFENEDALVMSRVAL